MIKSIPILNQKGNSNSLIDELTKVLYKIDPMGFSGYAPEDEYSIESAKIFEYLSKIEHKDKDSISRIVKEVFHLMLDIDLTVDHTNQITIAVLGLLTASTNSKQISSEESLESLLITDKIIHLLQNAYLMSKPKNIETLLLSSELKSTAIAINQALEKLEFINANTVSESIKTLLGIRYKKISKKQREVIINQLVQLYRSEIV